MRKPVPISARVNGGPPARTLADAVKLCDPLMPLDPDVDVALREDLDEVRGGARLEPIALNIRRAGGDAHTLHFLSGHLGGGKTTELLRLKERLMRAEDPHPGNTVFLLDADRELDTYNVDIEDIVVALWKVVFDQRPTVAATVLAPVWKHQIRGALANFVVNLPDAVPDAVRAVVGQLKLPGIPQRQNLRAAVSGVLNALIEGLNAALPKIAEDTAGAVVFLIDNLEKLSMGQRGDVEQLYLERMGVLKNLRAHLVITVPLFLCYGAGGVSLATRYGGSLVVLPMIKVRRRAADGGGDDPVGLAAMAGMLQRRVDFGTLFQSGEDAAKTIARLSGGSIRQALQLTLFAINLHDKARVTDASIRRAAASFQADIDRALDPSWVPTLRHIAQNNCFPNNLDGAVRAQLLQYLYVFEYQNGESKPCWHAVSPLVEGCSKYRDHGG